MKSIKQLALVAAMSSIGFGASAMTAMQDADLSAVSGQGISIAANVQMSIGSFIYTDTQNGGSFTASNIAVAGTFATSIDIISGTKFLQMTSSTSGTGEAFSVTGLTIDTDFGANGNAFYALGSAGTGSDVVKIAFPVLNNTKPLNVSVAAMTMGNGTISFGSVALNNIRLQGTTAYIWAH